MVRTPGGHALKPETVTRIAKEHAAARYENSLQVIRGARQRLANGIAQGWSEADIAAEREFQQELVDSFVQKYGHQPPV